MKEVRRDLQEPKITDTSDRDTITKKIDYWKKEPDQQYMPKWSEERKLAFSNKMEDYWTHKKNKNIKKSQRLTPPISERNLKIIRTKIH